MSTFAKPNGVYQLGSPAVRNKVLSTSAATYIYPTVISTLPHCSRICSNRPQERHRTNSPTNFLQNLKMPRQSGQSSRSRTQPGQVPDDTQYTQQTQQMGNPVTYPMIQAPPQQWQAQMQMPMQIPQPMGHPTFYNAGQMHPAYEQYLAQKQWLWHIQQQQCQIRMQQQQQQLEQAAMHQHYPQLQQHAQQPYRGAMQQPQASMLMVSGNVYFDNPPDWNNPNVQMVPFAAEQFQPATAAMNMVPAAPRVNSRGEIVDGHGISQTEDNMILEMVASAMREVEARERDKGEGVAQTPEMVLTTPSEGSPFDTA